MRLSKRLIVTISSIVLMVIFFVAYMTVLQPDEQNNRTEQNGFSNADQLKEQIALLKDSLRLAGNPEKRANFASRLSANYDLASQPDSAAQFQEYAAKELPNEETLFEAGRKFFNAFSVSNDPIEGQILAGKSEKYLNLLLKLDSTHVEGNVLLGVLYLITERTTEGVDVLRQVVENNPNHQEANFNLGVHALQAGAFQQASENFERIILQDSDNVQVTFYLALCYQQLDQKEEAVRLFKRVKELDSSAEVQANVDAYLNDIE